MARVKTPGICDMCGKPDHPPIKNLPKSNKYKGIDDAGDDLEEWHWNYLNGRCVVSRRLSEQEQQRLVMIIRDRRLPGWRHQVLPGNEAAMKVVAAAIPDFYIQHILPNGD